MKAFFKILILTCFHMGAFYLIQSKLKIICLSSSLLKALKKLFLLLLKTLHLSVGLLTRRKKALVLRIAVKDSSLSVY